MNDLSELTKVMTPAEQVSQTEVSVIIPIYNAEKYLRECLESIQFNKGVDFEVIMVNDGSTDESELICKHFVERNSNFKLFSITNSGPADARNYGISKANGSWVVFVDADDIIEPGYLKIPLLPENKDSDIVFANHAISNGSTIVPKNYLNCGERITDINEIKKLSLQSFNIYERYPIQKISYTIGKFYRRSLLYDNNISFPRGLFYYEDAIFLYNNLLHAKSVIFATKDTARYIIRKAEDSLTRTNDYKTITRKKEPHLFVYTHIYNVENAHAIENFYVDQFIYACKVIASCDSNIFKVFLRVRNMYTWIPMNTILRHSLHSGKKQFRNQYKQFFIIKTRLAYFYTLCCFIKNMLKI